VGDLTGYQVWPGTTNTEPEHQGHRSRQVEERQPWVEESGSRSTLNYIWPEEGTGALEQRTSSTRYDFS